MIGNLTENSQLRGTITAGGRAVEYIAGTGIDITENVISNTITSYNNLSDTPTLSSVATSGSYNDLSDLPTIPAELIAVDKTSDIVVNENAINSTGYLNCTTYGKMCVVSFNASIKNSLSAHTTLLSGLPKSLQARVVFCGFTKNNYGLRFYIEEDKIKNDGAISVGDWTNALLVYIVE